LCLMAVALCIARKEKKMTDEEILFFCFRYFLGRKTIYVSIFVEELLKRWETLSLRNQGMIKREIKQAIKYNRAGMSCDVQEWEKILKEK
jgi:hypothetical protein